jgi:alcohol dehydrogenase (NADP+)
MPLTGYFSLLKPHGQFIMVGAPEQPLPRISAHIFIMNNIFLGGSAIGSPADIAEMLELAAKKKVHGWVQTRPMKEVNEAVLDMENGNARYRYCLVNEKNLAELSQ